MKIWELSVYKRSIFVEDKNIEKANYVRLSYRNNFDAVAIVCFGSKMAYTSIHRSVQISLIFLVCTKQSLKPASIPIHPPTETKFLELSPSLPFTYYTKV